MIVYYIIIYIIYVHNIDTYIKYIYSDIQVFVASCVTSQITIHVRMFKNLPMYVYASFFHVWRVSRMYSFSFYIEIFSSKDVCINDI